MTLMQRELADDNRHLRSMEAFINHVQGKPVMIADAEQGYIIQQLVAVIAGHPSCTVCFWETFHKMYPDSPHEYVTFCHTCRRFDLYETEAEMKADNPKWW